MFAALLALLPALKLPSLSIETAKWIALFVAFLAWSGLCLYGGYRWESSKFETAKAKSAEHQLALQRQYQQLGDELGKAYEDAQTASQARTQSELQELGHATPKPAHRRQTHNVGVRNSVGDSDSARVVGVLRRAYAPSN